VPTAAFGGFRPEGAQWVLPPREATRRRRHSPGVRPVNPNPPKSAATLTEEPLKHVIETYVHRLQHVTCVCGWQGSSATNNGQTSEWTSRRVSVRGKRR